jgi:hypothetical protein
MLGNNNSVTSSTVYNNYLNSITTSLSNNDVNFGMILGGLQAPIGIQNITGSVFISGSNNMILSLGSQLPANQGRRGIIGNGNVINSIPTINTSSLTIPQINNNYNAGGITLTLTTGSNIGHNAHQVGNNVNLGGITWNHPSASIGAGQSSGINANINVGQITSTTTGPTLLTTQATLTNNIVSNNNLALNHISSSITFGQNIVGGAITTINNRYFTTGSNNNLAVSANILAGQQLVVNAAGSPATNVARTLVGNLIGGQLVNVSLEQTNTDLGGLRNSIVYGQGLHVTGSHSAANTAQQGVAIFGRWNGEDNGLADSARTVFAVGTGNATGNRRTSLYVTSGSLVGVSGSFLVSGSSAFSGDTQMFGNSGFPLTVNGTMNTKRIHFSSNPFNNDPSSNLGAIRFEGTNQTFYSTNYDLAEITTQSMVYQTVVTGSGLVETGLRSNNRGSDYFLSLTNQSGTGSLITNANTIVTGSLSVSNLATSTGSFVVTTDNNGTLTKAPFSEVAAVLFSQGQFAQTATLTAASGVSGSVSYDISGSVNGITLVSGSRLTIPTDGVYNIQFSAQWDAASGADTGWAWFKKNGTNIANSNSKVQLPNNTSNIMTVNILETAAVGDYYEVAWQNNAGHARLLGEAATGNLPAIPSVITTVTQVR